MKTKLASVSLLCKSHYFKTANIKILSAVRVNITVETIALPEWSAVRVNITIEATALPEWSAVRLISRSRSQLYLNDLLWAIISRSRPQLYLNDLLWGLISRLRPQLYLNDLLWGLISRLRPQLYLNDLLWGAELLYSAAQVLCCTLILPPQHSIKLFMHCCIRLSFHTQLYQLSAQYHHRLRLSPNSIRSILVRDQVQTRCLSIFEQK